MILALWHSKWNEFLPKQKWLFRAKTCFIKDSSNLGTESCLEEGDRRWGGRPGQTQDRVSKGRAKRQKKVQSDVDEVFWRRTGAGNGQKWLLSIWQQGEQGQQEKLVERKQNKAASFFGFISITLFIRINVSSNLFKFFNDNALKYKIIAMLKIFKKILNSKDIYL